VAPSEIDNLGHMNVRFYGRRAWLATQALLAGWGLDAEARDARGQVLIHQDSFNHYLKEQFEGAPLVVDGGVITAEPDDLRCYYEIINAQTGDRAAAFLVRPLLQDRQTRAPAAFPGELIEAARAARIDLPPRGAPRRLSLTPPRRDISLADLERRFGHLKADDEPSAMVVPDSACDAAGFMILTSAHDLMHFARTDRIRENGVPVFDGEGGARIGWAMLENRQVILATPRVGDALKAVRGQIRIDRKTQQNRNWIFNQTTGELLAAIDHVALAFDLAARRSTDIPKHMREELALRSAPDLA
jgi:acyl-CoA thioester hydrolase